MKKKNVLLRRLNLRVVELVNADGEKQINIEEREWFFWRTINDINGVVPLKFKSLEEAEPFMSAKIYSREHRVSDNDDISRDDAIRGVLSSGLVLMKALDIQDEPSERTSEALLSYHEKMAGVGQ